MATPTNLPAAVSVGGLVTADFTNNMRGAFRILQVVAGAQSSQTGNSTATYAATNLTANITPQATSNRIMINAVISGSISQANAQLGLRLVRRIGLTDTTIQTNTFSIYNSAGFTYAMVPFALVESPNTTTLCEYRIEFARTDGGGSVFTQVGNSTSTIILMEISA